MVNSEAPTETSHQRLDLHVPEQADLERLFDLYSDPQVWGPDPLTRHHDRAQTERMIGNWRAAWNRDGLGMCTAWDGDEFVGIGGCFVRYDLAWNLGFRLRPACWGRGYAQEISRAAILAARQRRVEMLAHPVYQAIGRVVDEALATPQLADFRVGPAPERERYRVVAWNIERGTHLEAQIETFRSHSQLRDADVLLITEADCGMARSRNRMAPEILARELGMTLAFAPCYIAFGKADPNWDWKTFDFDKDPARLADARKMINATDPALSLFRSRGGKLLMYFGWADPALNPLIGVGYYESVIERMGASTNDFFKLYMLPGVFHCSGGVGPAQL